MKQCIFWLAVILLAGLSRPAENNGKEKGCLSASAYHTENTFFAKLTCFDVSTNIRCTKELSEAEMNISMLDDEQNPYFTLTLKHPGRKVNLRFTNTYQVNALSKTPVILP